MSLILVVVSVLLLLAAPCFGQQKFGAGNPMCQARMPACPNKDGLACCMYPELFAKRTKRECKLNALRVKKPDGSVRYFEDSCYITCLFKNAGYNANKNISGDFILKALPDGDNEISKSYRTFADETIERCKAYYDAASNHQNFANLYRRTLNELDKRRPLCNMKLAAIWDCVHAFLLEKCPDMLMTKTSTCDSLQQFVYRCYFWGYEYVE